VADAHCGYGIIPSNSLAHYFNASHSDNAAERHAAVRLKPHYIDMLAIVFIMSAALGRWPGTRARLASTSALIRESAKAARCSALSQG
jgi:hypothetical protein